MIGNLVMQARRERDLSQRQLALRAGVTQASISRIERGLEAPSFERFERLMLVLGQRPVLTTEPLEHDVDAAELDAGRRLSHAERLREAASWNLLAMRLEQAGEAARRG